MRRYILNNELYNSHENVFKIRKKDLISDLFLRLGYLFKVLPSDHVFVREFFFIGPTLRLCLQIFLRLNKYNINSIKRH